MALVLHRSNRIELLARELAQIVRAPLADPLARECIVVQGPGMERWLSAELARELGVWANPWFPFPRAVVELLLSAALGEQESNPFAPEQLTWRIAGTLPDLLAEPAFRDVAAYLAHDRDGARLLELSRRLADNFDQYVVYRPELALAWERGEGSDFQAVLFRALARKLGPTHLAARLSQLEAWLARSEATPSAVPERVSLFGISTLPPAFVRLFARIAERLDVHVFLLTPSREYFGDLDREERGRSDLYGLLAQLGKVGREFLDLLAAESYQENPRDLFAQLGYDSVLHALQSDLVDITPRGRGGVLAAPVAVEEADDSLRVHVCHSVVRELEVLRDLLRDRFERDPTLEARDVIVLTPDIERYAPAIESVFGTDRAADEHAIPFRIADRHANRVSEVTEAFFGLLELAESRLYSSEVLDLLHRECVRERFAIAENEIERLERWLADSGARWGMDALHRGEFDQPTFAQNSLRFALDRLLSGYATRDGEQRDLYGVLPFSAVEGHDAVLLGKLSRYLETVFRAVRTLARAQSVASFAENATELLAACISADDELGLEHNTLHAALSDLREAAESAGFTREVKVASLRGLLEQSLERRRLNLGFLAGGVTFCEPVPMRSIPFRVVCLLGLDDEAFPRRAAPSTFDLLAERPRPGDRTVRDDDRQLFLEALLSARDALHLSYVGKSAQDGGERPPSVAVDHLLRVCDQHFVHASKGTLALAFEGSIARRLVVEHALHRFDARYFRPGSGYFSYDQTAAAALAASFAPKRRGAVFVPAPLPPLESAKEVTLEALARFYRRPHETFLKERLKIYLPKELRESADREPIVLDALERFRLAEELLELRGTSGLERARDERARLLEGAGKLAPGSIGRAQFDQLEGLIDELVAACPAEQPLPDRAFDLRLPSGRIHGVLRGLTRGQAVICSVGTLHTRRLLGHFIEHLALCATGREPSRTRVVGRRDKEAATSVVFAYVEDARERLDDLLRLYQLGLSMPLPLLHEASDCYARERAKGSDVKSALDKAQAKRSSARGQNLGMPDDPHLAQVFSNEQLDDLAALRARDGVEEADFCSVAERVFGPLLAHTESGS